MTATGQWYVAVRASSKTLAPEQLLSRIDQTFAAIRWPKEKAAAPTAVPIGVCTTALQQQEDAEPVKDVGAAVLANALTATVGDALDKAGVVTAPRWCRDPFKVEAAGVYRPDGAVDRYLIAFQDAGRGISVGPNGLAAILSDAASNAEPSFMVELIDIDRRTGFGSFKTLPGVAQALWLSQNGARSYVSSTWGKEKSITLSDDFGK